MADDDRVCRTCFPDATVYGEVVPGYALVRFGPRCGDGVRPGAGYGLIVDLHDVLCSWSEEPVGTGYGDDDDWKTLPEDDPRHAREDMHLDFGDYFLVALQLDAVAGHLLVKSCLEAGYERGKSGMLTCWLANRMAELIRRHDRAEYTDDPIMRS